MNPSSRFRASTNILFGQMLLAVLPIAVAICFVFFGGLGWRMAAASLLLTPFVWILACLVAELDQAEFDGDSGQILRRWRKPLPLADIESLRLLRSMGTVQVSARTHKGRSEMILLGIPVAEEERLRQALERWCPNVPLVARSYAAWKLTAVALVLMLAIYAAGMFWIRRESPVTRLACGSAPPATAEAGALVREGQGIVVRVPESFREARVRAIETGRFTEVGRIGGWFLRIADIGSEYELFRYAACARQGLVPMVLKTALLGQWEDAEVIESVREPHRRLAIMGTRNGAGEASILALNADHNVEALIALPLGGLVSRDELRRQLGAIVVEPAGAE